MMAIPGLVLFYGGLVRAKNMASVLTQVFVIVSVVALIWVCWGYSLAFTSGNPFVGGLDKMFLRGVDATTLAGTFSNGVCKIGRAHVGTPVTNAHLVCRLLHEHNKTTTY